MTTLINAHGPDHGLSVEIDRRIVTIREWCDSSNFDGESPGSHIREATIELGVLLNPERPHYKCTNRGAKSTHERIVDLALAWLSYWGGEEILVDDDDRPCQHFEMNYGGIGAQRTEPWSEHMTCEACGGRPEPEFVVVGQDGDEYAIGKRLGVENTGDDWRHS